MGVRVMISRVFTVIGIIAMLCIVGVGGYAAWYTYNRAQIIQRDLTCANPMRAPDGQMVCVQEIIPPTFIEKVFNLPPHPSEELEMFTIPIGDTLVRGPLPGAPVSVDLYAEFPPQSPHMPMVDILAATTAHPGYIPLMVQTGRVDEHISMDPTLEEVTICGTSLMARTLTFDGINVVKKLATMLPTSTTTSPHTVPEGVCFNLMPGHMNGEFYGSYRIAELPVLDVTSYYDSVTNHTKYIVVIGSTRFELDAETGDISELGGYDGSPVLVGNVKR